MTEYDPTFLDINGTEVHIGDTVSWLIDSFGGVETKSAKVIGMQFVQDDDEIKVRVRLQNHAQSMPTRRSSPPRPTSSPCSAAPTRPPMAVTASEARPDSRRPKAHSQDGPPKRPHLRADRPSLRHHCHHRLKHSHEGRHPAPTQLDRIGDSVPQGELPALRC